VVSKKYQSGIRRTTIILVVFWCKNDYFQVISKSYQMNNCNLNLILTSKWLVQETRE
jgi:hypothetical protein